MNGIFFRRCRERFVHKHGECCNIRQTRWIYLLQDFMNADKFPRFSCMHDWRLRSGKKVIVDHIEIARTLLHVDTRHNLFIHRHLLVAFLLLLRYKDIPTVFAMVENFLPVLALLSPDVEDVSPKISRSWACCHLWRGKPFLKDDVGESCSPLRARNRRKDDSCFSTPFFHSKNEM